MVTSNVSDGCYIGDAQIPGATLPWELNFIWCCLIYVDPYHGTSFMSPGVLRWLLDIWTISAPRLYMVLVPWILKTHILEYVCRNSEIIWMCPVGLKSLVVISSWKLRFALLLCNVKFTNYKVHSGNWSAPHDAVQVCLKHVLYHSSENKKSLVLGGCLVLLSFECLCCVLTG